MNARGSSCDHAGHVRAATRRPGPRRMARGLVLGRGAGRARRPWARLAGRRPSRPRGVDPPLHRPRGRRGPRGRRRGASGAPGRAGRALLRRRRDRRGRRARRRSGPRLRRRVLPGQGRVGRAIRPTSSYPPTAAGAAIVRTEGAHDHRSRPGHELLLRPVPAAGGGGRRRPAVPAAGGHLRPARDRGRVARPAVDLPAVLPGRCHPPAPPGGDGRALRRGRRRWTPTTPRSPRRRRPWSTSSSA